MNHDTYPDAYLRDILEGARTIAVVGASPRPGRASHGVMRFLQLHGYRAIPVNPFAAGEEILGERVYARLADIPENIDLVDIFRRSEGAPALLSTRPSRSTPTRYGCSSMSGTTQLPGAPRRGVSRW